MDNPLARKLRAEMSGDERIGNGTAEAFERVNLRQRIAELEAAVAEKDAALRQVEWVHKPDRRWTCDDPLQCQVCFQRYPDGHADDCSLQAALSGDAGERLLEAVRVLGQETIKRDEIEDYEEWRMQAEAQQNARYDARATLRELGVLEGK